MTRRNLIVVAGTLLCALILAGVALAMSSENYAINWDVTTSGGGGVMSSANYALQGTVGQSGAGGFSSSGYDLCLGFWCTEFEHNIFLPLVLKNHA
jgi:hypothetical protein